MEVLLPVLLKIDDDCDDVIIKTNIKMKTAAKKKTIKFRTLPLGSVGNFFNDTKVSHYKVSKVMKSLDE